MSPSVAPSEVEILLVDDDPDDVTLAMRALAKQHLANRVHVVRDGEEVQAGQRIGLIRFGSRVDIYLPDGQMPFVAVGQRSIAGETVLADLRANEGTRECRRS